MRPPRAHCADELGLIAASRAKPPGPPTPLATALVAGLKQPEVQVAVLLASVQQQIGTNRSVTLAAERPPVTPGYLAAPAPPGPAVAVPPPAAPMPAAAIPADQQMTTADRRRVQSALVRLGYYDGKVDGIFGPDSRAAIRRYQHELGAEMTGRLTAAQAERLVNGR